MHSELSKNILDKIQKEHIKPRPRWVFLLRNFVFWSIFAFSALLGGRGISVIIRVISESDVPLMMKAHGPILPPLWSLLPLFWIIFFLLFLLLASYGLHQTKHGYRYTTIRLIGVNLMMSFIVGVGSFALEESDVFEAALHQKAPYFQAIEEGLQQAWNQPEEGRLGGIILAVPDSNTIDLQAFDNQEWSITFDLTQPPATIPLQEGIVIRIIGLDQGGSVFQAEEIHPWPRPEQFKKRMLKNIQKNRQLLLPNP